MNKESFANEDIAQVLNKNFIPIKVDKEERPDIDAVYMMYLQASTGQGGWPLNVFLTPDTLEPFYGGTYWSGPTQAGDKMSSSVAKFETVLESVTQVWRTDNEKCRTSAQTIGSRLRDLVKAQSQGESTTFTSAIYDDVYDHFKSNYDKVHGGFMHAPKFPFAHNLSFLLKYYTYFGDSNNGKELAEMAATTLEKIGKGGIKDQIGHGFARYSVTEDWNLPHFEKMLYDQPLLLNAYVDAYLYNPSEFAKYYANDIVEYLTTDLSSPEGGFYSAQDADSINSDGEHVEGAYYVWKYNEFYNVLRQKNHKELDIDMAAMYWNVREYGNVDKQYDIQNELNLQNVLSENNVTMDEVARTFGKNVQQVKDVIESCRKDLREYREKYRQKPEIDTKIITSWNGLAIGALAKAGIVLDNEQYILRARQAADFLLNNSYNPETQTLRRVYKSSTNGMNDDYAYLISGLLDLYESTFDTKYLDWAQKLQDTQLRLFWDGENGGFFAVELENAADLIFRPKNGFDGAEPSTNGVSAMNLYRLSSFFYIDSPDNHKITKNYKKAAEKILDCYGQDLAAQPFGYCTMLGAVIARMNSMQNMVILTSNADVSKVHKQLVGLRSKWPNSTIVLLNEDSIKFFEDVGAYKQMYEAYKQGAGETKVMVCNDRECVPLVDHS